jgi:hypothetical protein
LQTRVDACVHSGLPLLPVWAAQRSFVTAFDGRLLRRLAFQPGRVAYDGTNALPKWLGNISRIGLF